MPVIVICLEGCHGSGKTALTHAFADAGITVLDEGFMTMSANLVHPQSLLMETTWVCAWFQRLLQHVSALGKGDQHRVIIADRSPLSAVFYSRTNGPRLEPVIRTFVDEVREAAGLHVLTAHIRAEPERLWTRIQDRLRREPHRLALNEDSRAWMEQTLSFYDRTTWDATVPNNDVSIQQLMGNVIKSLMPVSPALAATIATAYGSVEQLVAGAGTSTGSSGPATASTATAAFSAGGAGSTCPSPSSITPAKSRKRQDSEHDPVSPTLYLPLPPSSSPTSPASSPASSPGMGEPAIPVGTPFHAISTVMEDVV